MDPAIIIALISLGGSIILNGFQFFKDKKKADVDAITQLIQKALEMNKQELEVVRLISQDLRMQLEEEKKENEILHKENEDLRKEVQILRAEKENSDRRLALCELKLQEYEKRFKDA